MSIISSIQDKLGITARRDEENRKRALRGQTTSGYLRQGERDRMFRLAKGTHPSNRPAKRRWWNR